MCGDEPFVVSARLICFIEAFVHMHITLVVSDRVIFVLEKLLHAESVANIF